MSKSWCWDSKTKTPFLISLHIIILIQNMLLVDTPNFFRNTINSFLSEHITVITGTDGTHGYIRYITCSKYKWKYLAEAAVPGGKWSTRQIILILCAYNRSSENFTSITELNQTASFQAKVLQNLLMEQSGMNNQESRTFSWLHTLHYVPQVPWEVQTRLSLESPSCPGTHWRN